MSSKTRRTLLVVARLACALALPVLNLACSGPATCTDGQDCEDAGALPPDFCNSRAEADSDSAHCWLTVNGADGGWLTDVYISRLEDGGVDQDWYLAKMPPTLTARSLLRVTGGYSGIQTTGVNFSVNVLTPNASGALSSIASGIDNHGASAPKLVDLVVPFSQANADVYVLVADGTSGTKHNVDNRNPYAVRVQVMDNPDPNEPNDAADGGTPIALAASTNGSEGKAFGYLATQNDVDQYTFNVTGSGNRLIYLHITGPNPQVTPLPPFALAYTLYDPSGNAVSTDHMVTATPPVDLATSRVVTMNGTWRLEIAGYRDPNTTEVIPGDLNLRYDVDVQVMDDKDTNEPNDTATTAKAITLAAPGTGSSVSQPLSGKSSTVPDEEWFKITMKAGARPSTLRYELKVASSGGRFAPTTPASARQVRILSTVTDGANIQEKQYNCENKQSTCPKGYSSASSTQATLVSELCNLEDGGSMCLQSQRGEATLQFSNLQNFVGAVLVPASAVDTEYWVMVRANGGATTATSYANTAFPLYADDRDWTLNLIRADDGDEALGSPRVQGVNGSVAGSISYGYGAFIKDWDGTNPHGIRGDLRDYDSYETDEDLFEFTGLGAADLGWLPSWTIQKADGGVVPGELVFELTFCSGAAPSPDGGLCVGASQPYVMGYNEQKATPWYLDANQASNADYLFTESPGGTSVTISAVQKGCWCFSKAQASAGQYFLKVRGANRVSNAPIDYTITQSTGAYPSFFTGFACPAGQVVDGGGGAAGCACFSN